MTIALISRYRLEEDIGSGAYGRVVKAFDTMLERPVALKILNASDSGIDERKSLLREAKMLARLRHPNIVTLYDMVEHDDEVYLAMEYVEGQMLSTRLAAGAMSVDAAVRAIGHLASGLAAAHELGVLHGDIKPANIMLDQAGAPRLIDFGLAKFFGRDDALATATMSGRVSSSLAGTLPYMAPEVIMGRVGDARADIFSLGAVFYEMLSKRRAFEANSHGEVLQSVLNETPQSLRSIQPEIPGAVSTLVDRMLVKDPKVRLQSMAEVCIALAAARGRRGGLGALGLRLSYWTRVLMRPRRTPQWAKITAGVAALSIVAWAGVVVTRDVAPPLSVRMEQGVDLVRNFEKKGAVKKAQDIFGRILSSDPEHAAAQAGLALALIREYTSMETDPATLRRATVYAEAALKEDPHLALANIAAGWAAEFNSDFNRAHMLYDATEMLDPNNPLVLEGRARTLKKQGDYDGAITVLEAAIKRYPDGRVFYDDIGNIFSRKGEYKKAEEAYRNSIKIAPDNTVAYASLSHELHMQGRTTEAILVTQDGLKIKGDAELYNNLGVYLFFQGRYGQSAQAFERTLEFEGNAHQYRYWANLADAYRWAPGRRLEADEAYRRAIQLLNIEIDKRPEHPALHSRNALYHVKAGDFETASASLEKVLNYHQLPPIQLYRATVTLEILGDRQGALRMLERALDAGYAFNEIANDPELAVLRQDMNYQKLITRKGLPHG